MHIGIPYYPLTLGHVPGSIDLIPCGCPRNPGWWRMFDRPRRSGRRQSPNLTKRGHRRQHQG